MSMQDKLKAFMIATNTSTTGDAMQSPSTDPLLQRQDTGPLICLSCCVGGTEGALSVFGKLQSVTASFLQEMEGKLSSADHTEVSKVLESIYSPLDTLMDRLSLFSKIETSAEWTISFFTSGRVV